MIAYLLAFFAMTASAAPGGFDVYADRGRLHRLEGRSGKDVALHYLRSDDGGKTWTAPVRVDGGRPAYHFSAGDARVAAEGDAVYAVWARSGDGPMHSGPLAVARSTDGGRSWGEAASPSGGGTHGRRFPALALSSGVLHAVWLDRESKSKVMASRSTDGARSWSAPFVLDPDACECCWNAALAAGDGAVHALYRGKDPRDMNAAVSRDGGATWSKPAAAGAFGWGFNGCPHVGGALAARSGDIHAVVWTGHEEKAGLYVLSSKDGLAWEGAVELGGAGAKHADLTSSGARLAAVWSDGGRIWSALSADGRSWSKPKTLSGKNASASYPRVAPAGSGFRAFWREKERFNDAPLK
ncbi:MAG: sialidase family protein [Elusimicrobiota bacterium]|nr:sialidase family protein [Elusimicrobiota bacterium]